jgi:hypothetical protein
MEVGRMAFGSIPAAHSPVLYDAETSLQAASSTQLVKRASESELLTRHRDALAWSRKYSALDVTNAAGIGRNLPRDLSDLGLPVQLPEVHLFVPPAQEA